MLHTTAAAPLHLATLAPLTDNLGVLTSTLPVVLADPHVWINYHRLVQIAAQWSQEPWPADEWDTTLHYYDDNTDHMLNWLAVLDALNFCFWGPPNEPRWQVNWQGSWQNGYAALAAALTRAVINGHPLWDATYLRTMTAPTLYAILHPDQSSTTQIPAIPLFATRLAHLHELGTVLAEHYHGQFSAMVTAAKGSAVTLVQMITTHLPSFHDVTQWQGSEIRFYKRGQILVGDVATAYANTAMGTFSDIGELTAFADYKVPQLLRRLGIVDYAPTLAAIIDQHQQLAAGSPDEVAIRAATIWGVELVRRAIADNGIATTAIAIDHRLWQAGQQVDSADRPYHRTLTSFY